MTQSIRIIPANPAGNKTIFVTTPVERPNYQAIASFLLSLDEYEAEQVAFILPDGSMEMSGLEFCGNASRTYGLIRAEELGEARKGTIEINVSGCDHPLNVEYDTASSFTKINMPVPLSVTNYRNDILVDLGGILHLVTTGKQADPNTFQRLKNRIMTEFRPPAFGVMFLDPDKGTMTPVVYVADIDSSYFEGSCGSGTVAAAAALTMDMTDGEAALTINQPKGTLTAVIKKRQNEIVSVSIEGPVIIEDPVTIQLPQELQL